MRLASTSTVASSGTRPPSTTLSAASHAASKPEDSLARPIDLSVRLLPAESIWIGNTYLDDSGRDSPAFLNSTGDM